MYKLENDRLKREFKIIDGTLFASKITNKYSGLDFIPDGSGSEFVIKFKDGDEFTSKGLHVTESIEKDGRLFFRFAETMNTTVTLNYRLGRDKNTIEKQIAITQSEPKTIDYVLLENIGIVNSSSYFTVNESKMDVDSYFNQSDPYVSTLGQPFYIDSLFFGCEFPASKNEILHGRGQITYFVGKDIDSKLICPSTVIGAAKGSALIDLKKSFFEYINKISLPSPYRVQYNTWYDKMLNITEDNIEKAFYKVESKLSSHNVEPLDGYVVDDGWNDYKSSFWSFHPKKFPNGLIYISETVNKFGSKFGVWLGPRGGYNYQTPFAKRMEKKGYGYFNAQARDICIASKKYCENIKEFLVNTTVENDISYWKLDGFNLIPCTNNNHDHATGGAHNMYFVTEMWHRWIEIFKALHNARAKQGKRMWINMTCYVNPSPWWLQYVNSIWLQNSGDIGFAENYEKGKQAQVDAEITYRDGIYYDFWFKRCLQFPADRIYNHEPIYGAEAHLDYTDEEFEKAFFFNACRGAALNELYVSPHMMSEGKWQALANCINWQKANYHILKNAMFIGGNPTENNVYCYASWTENGEGIIALRNPTNEAAPLTLTLNKLMGCPETLHNVKRYNVLNKTAAESSDIYNYNDKINLTLAPFEIKIIQFGEEDRRYAYPQQGNDFTITFKTNGKDGMICENDDILIKIEKGYIIAAVGTVSLKSQSLVHSESHRITIVREKNRMVKIYIDNKLDCSGYDKKAKAEISTNLTSTAEDFKIIGNATPYNEILVPALLQKSRWKKKKEGTF